MALKTNLYDTPDKPTYRITHKHYRYIQIHEYIHLWMGQGGFCCCALLFSSAFVRAEQRARNSIDDRVGRQRELQCIKHERHKFMTSKVFFV